MSTEQKQSALDKFLFKLKRRRTKYIDPKQQSRLAFEIILMVITLPALFYIFTISELWTLIFFGDQAETMRNLFHSQLMLLKKAWLVILIILVFIVFLSVFFTHKIFGPMFRFRQILEAKLNGEGDIYFTLRKGDYFQDFSHVVQKIALCKVDVPQDVKLRGDDGEVFDMSSNEEVQEEEEASSEDESS